MDGERLVQVNITVEVPRIYFRLWIDSKTSGEEVSSLTRALQREKRRGLVTQPEEPIQMKGKIEEERRQQTEAGTKLQNANAGLSNRDHFRTWWVILGGSGLRNGWEVQRRGRGETMRSTWEGHEVLGGAHEEGC